MDMDPVNLEKALSITGIPSTYKQFLGFDCANKSLGYTLAYYNTSLHSQLDELKSKLLKEFESFAPFKSYCAAYNANEAARTLIQKTKTGKPLSEALTSLQNEILLNPKLITLLGKYIVESYFIINKSLITKSCGVIDLIPGKKVKETSLLERTLPLKKFLSTIKPDVDAVVIIEEQPATVNDKSNTVQDQICYEYCGNYEVKNILPKWKNRLCFGEGLSYEEIRAKYKKKYTANKVHSKLNFLKYIDMTGQTKMLEGVKKDNYDDLADSCMQIIAYVKFADNNI